MKVIAVEESTLSLPDLAELAKDGPVILTQKGEPLASVQMLDGADWESVALANDPGFTALIEEARRHCRAHGAISLESVLQELGLKPAPRRRSDQ